MKLRIIHLGVTSKGIEVKLEGKLLGHCKTIKKLKQIWDKYHFQENESDIVMCSSSMDFPKEYTKDKRVIELARKIRG